MLGGLGQVRTVAPGEGPRALARALREERPDCVLVLTEKKAGYLSAYLSGAPRRAGFDPGLSQPLKAMWLRLALTDRVRYPNDPEQDPGLHEVERYHRLVESVGVPPAEPGPLHLPLTPELKRGGLDWLAGRGLHQPVGLQLTPKWERDGWPTEFVRAVFRTLPEPRLVFYGPSERAWAEQLMGDCRAEGCCLPDLLEYGAVLKGCRLLVTPDTGAAHLSAAVGVPVVDVFRARHHQHCVRRWRPWQVPHRVVIKPAYRAQEEKPLMESLLCALKELL